MACFKLIIIKVLHVQIQIKKVENFEAYVAHYADCSFYCYLLLQWIIHNIYIMVSVDSGTAQKARKIAKCHQRESFCWIPSQRGLLETLGLSYFIS